jgi:hypothetical protein
MRKIALAATMLFASPVFAADSDRGSPEWLRQYFAHITAYCVAKGEIPEFSSKPADVESRAWAQQRTSVLEQTLKQMVFPASGDPAPVPECTEPSSIALVRCAMKPGLSAGCKAPEMRAVATKAVALLADAGVQAKARMKSVSSR